MNHQDDCWLRKENSNWGKWGKDDEKGLLNEMSPALVAKALSLVKNNKVYDLEAPRFKGMSVWPGHPGWDIVPYASPHGRQNMAKHGQYGQAYNWNGVGGWLDPAINKYHSGLNSEMLIGSMHVGTHIDSLSHFTAGEDNHWYNGFNTAEHWGDYGPLKADASNIPPIVLPGVLLDIPGYKGVPHLQPEEPVTVEDIKGCAAWAGVSLEKGDCVLIRTGMIWPEMDTAPNAGPTLDTVRYLVEECGAFLLGNDQVAFENFPGGASSFPGHVHPVHEYLLVQKGVHIMEMVMTGELARDKVYRFCFITLPASIRGATGMMIRPIAIA